MIIKNSHLDLEQIDQSGQCFRWSREPDGSYCIPAYGRVLHARMLSPDTVAFDCTDADWQNIWAEYFDMETDYAAIAESIDTTDIYLRAAAASGYGIRILRQPLWETIVSFIVSQNNNIPRIRLTMARLCGESADCPAPQQIAGMSDAELRKIGLGYRADYLLQAAAAFSSETELEHLAGMPYAEAREYLTSLRGIGPKVADCICLFGLHHTEAFPVDTWVRRIEAAHYAGHFPTQLYPGVQGIMQQWMFAYERILALHR